MHARQTVLENLPPYIADDYEQAAERFVGHYAPGEEDGSVRQFCLEHISDPESKTRGMILFSIPWG